MRLQKYLADCGVCSRRKAEEMIAAGRVFINGNQASLGARVDASCDKVSVDGKLKQLPDKKVWIMLHKPEGYITSSKDQFGRKTVLDLLQGIDSRVFPVGRLDYDTSGLLLLTNDGETANKLMHPSYNVEKVYLVSVKQTPSPEVLDVLRNGVEVDGKITRPAVVSVVDEENGLCYLKIGVKEGRNRIVRKMFSAVGHEVISLKRLSIGWLEMGDLAKGTYRELSEHEITELFVDAM